MRSNTISIACVRDPSMGATRVSYSTHSGPGKREVMCHAPTSLVTDIGRNLTEVNRLARARFNIWGRLGSRRRRRGRCTLRGVVKSQPSSTGLFLISRISWMLRETPVLPDAVKLVGPISTVLALDAQVWHACRGRVDRDLMQASCIMSEGYAAAGYSPFTW